MTVAGIVLAAGAGSRFGPGSKLLAELHGRPLLEHVVGAACAALERVVVVLGAGASEVRATTELGSAQVTVCADWAEGQSASLRHGIRALGHDVDRALVLLGDQPLVPPSAIRRMASEPPGSRAAYGGRPGHPAVLGADEMRLASVLRGDRGLRDLVRWRLVELGFPEAIRDVDTPGDLAALQSARYGPAVAPPPSQAQ